MRRVQRVVSSCASRLGLLLLFAACAAPPPVPPAGGAAWAVDSNVDAAWTEMQRALVGRFQYKPPPTAAQGRTITVSYRAVSNGTALVETFTSSSGKETVSVYHRDAKAMMLTHYCAQGNQARLKAVEASREKVVFAFLDATNVTADQDVMHRLAVVFRPDGFDQETVYRTSSGEDEKTTLHFVRVPD